MVRKRSILLLSIISMIIIGSSLGIGLYFGLSKPTQLFIAIHCEPGSFPRTTDYPTQYWPSLVAMVTQADLYGVKLTLLFNPQWGEYILQYTPRLIIIQEWEANGHEIGLHIHGPHMSSWCGYTNQITYQNDSNYIGTIADMMILMNQLPHYGYIHTVCSATEEDIIYDYPSGVLYSTSGGSNKIAHYWSKPQTIVYNGQPTTGVTHARYDNIQSEINIDFTEFKELYKQRNREYVMGLVWHDFNYADNPIGFIQLFTYLHAQGIRTLTVKDICG